MSDTIPFKFSLVACARWEENSIVEWINYHLSIGFDHVFLYSNDDDPTAIYEAVQPFISAPARVTFNHFPFLGQQRQIYLDFLRRYKSRTEFFMFLDIDEFVNLKRHKRLVDFIDSLDFSFDSLSFNWSVFGNSGFRERPTGSVLRQYTWRQRELDPHTKVLTRSSSLLMETIKSWSHSFWHDWGANAISPARRVNVIGDSVDDYWKHFPYSAQEYLRELNKAEAIESTAVINHYSIKSEGDLQRRVDRGSFGDFVGQANWGRLDANSAREFLLKLSQIQDLALKQLSEASLLAAWTNRAKLPAASRLDMSKATADQSSLSEWSAGETPEQDARNVLAADPTGYHSNHTAVEPKAWWQVDLGASMQISEIRFFNRVDHPDMRQRMSFFKVQAADNLASWITLADEENHEFGGLDGDPLIVSLSPPREFRYVRFTLTKMGCIHFDNVQFFG